MTLDKDNMRTWLAVIGIACIGNCNGQSVDNARSAVIGQVKLESYLLFFDELIQKNNSSGPVTLNGAPSGLVSISVQEAIGITDRDVEALTRVAQQCERSIADVHREAKEMVFESRISAAASDTAEPDAASRQYLAELARRQNVIVSGCVQNLKEALGDTQFRMINDYITSRQSSRTFFPLISAQRVSGTPKAQPTDQ